MRKLISDFLQIGLALFIIVGFGFGLWAIANPVKVRRMTDRHKGLMEHGYTIWEADDIVSGKREKERRDSLRIDREARIMARRLKAEWLAEKGLGIEP